MPGDTIKVRANLKDDVTEVKALISHPMELGGRKDEKTGEEIKAEYIEQVTAEHNGNNVMTAYWSSGVSKNPYLNFKFKGAKADDTLTLAWKDNTGKSDSTQVKIKG